MNKKYFYIFSFTPTLIYWFLDAYANTLLYPTSFASEVLLLGPHNAPLIKIIIALMIFSATFFPFYYTKATQQNNAQEPHTEILDGLKQLSDILYSPLTPKITIAKALDKLTSLLELEASILFIYQKDTLLIYNESPFVKSHFKTKELFPFRSNVTLDPIEKIAHTCFLEKRAFSQDTIADENQKLTLNSFILKESKSDSVIGNLMLILDHTNSIEKDMELIQKFIEHLIFTLNVAQKKEVFAATNTMLSTETTNIDKELAILNHLKFMECIEDEFKRNRRYHTELTLMLIDIPMLKTLTNIFPANVVLSLKKDFINLVQKNIRDVDIFGKWSNDQFGLLLANVDFRAAQGVAKKIQAILENHKFVQIGKISCSFGITSLSQKDTLSSFRMRAESALNFANSKEGNQIEVKLLL
ncbi:MAG: diguanylate cyclase [Sulfurospirillaceae bacterium]|nr:diguanylate cyclase [Sulfurospirillaceae bacterium]